MSDRIEAATPEHEVKPEAGGAASDRIDAATPEHEVEPRLEAQ